MSLDENVEFITEHLERFRLMQSDTERHHDVATQQLAALRTRIDDLRQDVRASRETLTSASHSPSIAVVRQQRQLEDRVERLEALHQDLRLGGPCLSNH